MCVCVRARALAGGRRDVGARGRIGHASFGSPAWTEHRPYCPSAGRITPRRRAGAFSRGPPTRPRRFPPDGSVPARRAPWARPRAYIHRDVASSTHSTIADHRTDGIADVSDARAVWASFSVLFFCFFLVFYLCILWTSGVFDCVGWAGGISPNPSFWFSLSLSRSPHSTVPQMIRAASSVWRWSIPLFFHTGRLAFTVRRTCFTRPVAF